MMVEILAGAFVKSHFGFQASSFFDQEGGPPCVGQLLICINPFEFNPDFLEHVEVLINELLSEKGSSFRIPGARRLEKRQLAIKTGIYYPKLLIDRLEALDFR